jgi:hypothetical protein
VLEDVTLARQWANPEVEDPSLGYHAELQGVLACTYDRLTVEARGIRFWAEQGGVTPRSDVIVNARGRIDHVRDVQLRGELGGERDLAVDGGIFQRVGKVGWIGVRGGWLSAPDFAGDAIFRVAAVLELRTHPLLSGAYHR